jgi:hypothetical protein
MIPARLREGQGGQIASSDRGARGMHAASQAGKPRSLHMRGDQTPRTAPTMATRVPKHSRDRAAFMRAHRIGRRCAAPCFPGIAPGELGEYQTAMPDVIAIRVR